ncbi:class I SAM-dependent methyltransferase [Pseudomonas sp. TH03]|uniref:class I SAM-dependent methyltransferase n=1 Tax=Pseudomonas sp. TH03 TaxID=2796369 RepID=UPI001912BA02|nr:class I SAM-dependent methyltransferase [Pseudomonas sp. TH03]MBK5553882.1 class I SAM-dependent methyltransferase [Pseudomonas sp. TH03]
MAREISGLNLPEGSLALDLGCGYGRNSALLSRYFENVIAADISCKGFSGLWYLDCKNIHPVILDCGQLLPFLNNTFSAVIVVHLYHEDLIANLIDIIQPGGFFIYESISGNGENWRELSLFGEVKRLLEKQFIVKYYLERPVGPDKKNATVKVVAQKKKTESLAAL